MDKIDRLASIEKTCLDLSSHGVDDVLNEGLKASDGGLGEELAKCTATFAVQAMRNR